MGIHFPFLGCNKPKLLTLYNTIYETCVMYECAYTKFIVYDEKLMITRINTINNNNSINNNLKPSKN